LVGGKISRWTKFKNWVFEQMEKFVQFNAIGMPALLVMNLASSLFVYVQYRSVHPYVGISSLFVSLFFAYWLVSHLVVRKGGTYLNRSRAAIKYNQYSVWAIPPFQWMMIMYVWMDGIKDKEKKAKVENWLKLGYIPKKDFPDELKEFYIAKEGNR